MSQKSNQQHLFLIISRFNLNPAVIPPFKIIIPTLQLICPLRLFSSMGNEITLTSSQNNLPATSNNNFGTLYDALIHHLQNQQGQVSLNKTMDFIYGIKINQQNKNKSNGKNSTNTWKFRICVLGEEIISWDIVMKFKLKNVIIDTIGHNKRLKQISFATGGINKSPILNQNITKLFLTIYSLSTQCRKKFNFLFLSKDDQTSSQSIQFTVDCVCCRPQPKELSGQCYLCSRCLAVHCSKITQTCFQCGAALQNMELKQKPC